MSKDKQGQLKKKDRLVLSSEADESTNAKLTRGPRFRAASHEVFLALHLC